MMSPFLDVLRRNKKERCKLKECKDTEKEIFLYDINRETTFRICKGKLWHPEMCIICLVESYVGGEDAHQLFKVANIRGCLWINFEERKAALRFLKYICRINLEETIVLKEIPAHLSGLILKIESEERW